VQLRGRATPRALRRRARPWAYRSNGYASHQYGSNGYGAGGYDGGGGGRDSRIFRFWSPSTQSFPASNAEVAALGWSAVAGGYAMQDSSAGSTLTDFSGNGRTLTKAITPANLIQGQRAVGLYDGSSFTSQLCVECTETASERWLAPAVADFNYDFAAGQSWSVLLMVKLRIPGTTRGLVGNRSTVGGWDVRVLSSGVLQANLYNAAGAIVATAQSTGSCVDGAWHFIYVRFNAGTQRVLIDTDYVTGVTSAAPTGTPAVSNTQVGLGGSNFLASFAGQCRGMVIWPDVSTTLASIQAWWRHGSTAGLGLYSYDRPSATTALCVPVADDSTGEVLAGWSAIQVPVERDANITTNAAKIGLSSWVTTTNLILNTELNDNAVWVPTGTKTVNAKDDPRGYRAAIKHSGTALEFVLAAAATAGASLTSGTAYTAYVWYAWDGTGTAPKMEVRRLDGTTVVATATATTGGTLWRRMEVTFTAGATEAHRMALFGLDGNAWFSMPQIATGLYARPWCATRGSTTATGSARAYVQVPGLTASVGTMKAWATTKGQDTAASRYFFDAVNTVNVRNYSRELQINPSEIIVGSTYNAAGVFVNQVIGAGGAIPNLTALELIAVMQWDASEANGWSTRCAINTNLRVGTDATNLVTGASTEFVAVGSLYTGSNIDGVVSQLQVWTKVELAA
jgi:hypothetical protein